MYPIVLIGDGRSPSLLLPSKLLRHCSVFVKPSLEVLRVTPCLTMGSFVRVPFYKCISGLDRCLHNY